MDLDISGNHYSRHISAMTREGLHSKSDIAAELAWLDARIAELEARTVKLPSQVDFDDPLSAYEAIKKCQEVMSAAGIKWESE